MADEPQNHERLIQGFMGMAGVTREEAQKFLEQFDYDEASAGEAFLAQNSGSEAQDIQAADDSYTGPRTLDGRRAPEASSSRPPRQTASQPRTQKQRGIFTLGSVDSNSQSHHDDEAGFGDGNDDGKDDNGVESFTGGEKSGLAVKDPKKSKHGSRQTREDIMAQAESSARSDPTTQAGPSRSSHFRGAGVTLGGEGTESRVVADPLGPASSFVRPRQRTLHWWRDGFSIDDGKLYSYDDPANDVYLKKIKAGEAPQELMDINPNEPVDVRLLEHDTPYPKKRDNFGGAGNTLGNASQSENDTASTAANTAAETNTPQPAQSNAASANAPSEDDSEPRVKIVVKIPNGKIEHRYKLDQTMADVYAVVRADPRTPKGDWDLVTFPATYHPDDDTKKIDDIKELRKGGMANLRKR